MEYPATRCDESVVEELHGHTIADPFRWLEDPNSEETVAWVQQQTACFEKFMSRSEIREKIKKILEKMYDYEKWGCPSREGDIIAYYYNPGMLNQPVLYVKDTLDQKEGKVLLDPNHLSEDGTASLGATAFSENAKFLAYGVSLSGSDWQVVHIRDVTTGEDLADKLEWVKFSGIAWTHDHKGFFYSRYPIPASFSSLEGQDIGDKRGSEVDANAHQKLYYHVVGTAASEDVLVFEIPEHPKWLVSASVSHDGNFVFIYLREGTAHANQLRFMDLRPTGGSFVAGTPVVNLVDNFDAEYRYVANLGSTCLFSSNHKAPRSKIITMNLDALEEERKDLIPEGENVLESCFGAGGKLVLEYLEDCKSVIRIADASSGQVFGKVDLPVGSVWDASGRWQDDDIFVKFTSFTSPGTIFRVDISSLAVETLQVTNVPGLRDPEDFVTEQVFFESGDAPRIPMFITHRKDFVPSGAAPTLLYGYGGFGISLTPFFSVFKIFVAEYMNGVLAVANIRGGGEYGEDWHYDGALMKKQNCFTDFTNAARCLFDRGYTCPEKLTIQGGSNGGLLVAACANQAPELFGAVVAQVGVMDMLRFHKFTIGYAWISDYGSPEKPEDFENLLKFSPLHNIRSGVKYPAVLVLTSDHDDRVVPLHSLKYIAQLQRVAGPLSDEKRPLLARIEQKAGHGAGKPTAKVIEENADIYAFMAQCLGIELGNEE